MQTETKVARVQPSHDLIESVDHYGTVRFTVEHIDTPVTPVFRVEVWPSEEATRWTQKRPAHVSFHSSSSHGEDAEAALAIAEAIRRAGLKAAEMDSEA